MSCLGGLDGVAASSRPGLQLGRSPDNEQLTQILHILENTLYTFSPLTQRSDPTTLPLILVLRFKELIRSYPFTLLRCRRSNLARLFTI
jgi:hypothetical protein